MRKVVKNQKTAQKGGSSHRRMAQTQFLTTVGPRNRLEKKICLLSKISNFKKKSAYMIPLKKEVLLV